MKKLEEIHLVSELRILADHFSEVSSVNLTIGEIEEIIADVMSKLKTVKFR